MNKDEIVIEILEDGTIKIETSKIGAANHVKADQFLQEIARLTGGPVTIEKKQPRSNYVTQNKIKQ